MCVSASTLGVRRCFRCGDWMCKLMPPATSKRTDTRRCAAAAEPPTAPLDLAGSCAGGSSCCLSPPKPNFESSRRTMPSSSGAGSSAAVPPPLLREGSACAASRSLSPPAPAAVGSTTMWSLTSGASPRSATSALCMRAWTCSSGRRSGGCGPVWEVWQVGWRCGFMLHAGLPAPPCTPSAFCFRSNPRPSPAIP
eukprot:288279-Chlamydomonas_euryale.AAC.1